MPITLTPRRAKIALAGGLSALLSLCCCGGIIAANWDATPARPLPALNAPPTTPSGPKPAASQVLASSPSPTPSPSSTSPAAPLTLPSKPAASPKPPTVAKLSPTPKRTTARPKPPPPPLDEPEPPVFYANCAAVKAAGAAPIRRGQPGYGRHLDRDGDGTGCE